ncbi:ABC transporter permease subunit [Enterococcus eurekensis]|uniref:ABC transporter permease subunit n=1 Tax=Enterococcus eurekensis TaxID=1159753 RepID=A0ABV9M4K0_9ENTE
MRAMNAKRLTQWLVLVFFVLFLALPLLKVFVTAWPQQAENPLAEMSHVFNRKWQESFKNSLSYALIATSFSTLLGFLLVYGANFTQIGRRFIRFNTRILLLPMLLPTITYGFVLIYAFGKQGLWSKISGQQWFNIYGTIGILLGFVIYTLPPIFMLINNSMKYVDTRLFIVSRLMGDKWYTSLHKTIISPLYRVLAVAFLQGFFMTFTDFGIPSALGGQTPFITTLLYEGFMGTIPDFQFGSMVALTMLLPSIVSVVILNYLQKKMVRYDKPQCLVLKKNTFRDNAFRVLFLVTSAFMLLVFLVLFVIPFMGSWPNKLYFTLEHFQKFVQDQFLMKTLKNALLMSLLTAVFGTLLAYFAAIVTSRGKEHTWFKSAIDSISAITNSIPGMVLGVSFLLIFSGGVLHNTLAILVIVTIVHYFSTPYQMAKEALQKMNLNWENSARLMGDSWLKTIWRILIPSSRETILEMVGYYFSNAMVTISAVIFLSSSNTMVITTKLKELQHFGKFNEIFILSLFLLIINLGVQNLIQWIRRSILNENEKKSFTRIGYMLRTFRSVR